MFAYADSRKIPNESFVLVRVALVKFMTKVNPPASSTVSLRLDRVCHDSEWEVVRMGDVHKGESERDGEASRSEV